MAGCGGMLGEAFYNCFKDNYDLMCTDIDVNEDWLNPLDFRNYDKYLLDVEKFKPNYLFHIGAHTSLEYCELNEDDAYKTNTLSVENAVNISAVNNSGCAEITSNVCFPMEPVDPYIAIFF